MSFASFDPSFVTAKTAVYFIVSQIHGYLESLVRPR